MSRARKRGAVVLAVLLGVLVAAPAPAEGLFDRPLKPRQLVDTVLADVAATFSTTQVLNGKFVQRRQISGLPRPLTSSGDFLLARGEGILWRTSTPFTSEFVLSPRGMTLRSGGTEQRVTEAEQPALRTALEMLFAMFSMDLDRLDANFELHGRSLGARWEIGLRPRTGGLSQAFSEAIVSGSKQVDRIVLTGAAGDRTEIEFSDVVARSAPLDAAEAEPFRR